MSAADEVTTAGETRKDEEIETMDERSGYLAGVDLDGPDGCALLTVRVTAPSPGEGDVSGH